MITSTSNPKVKELALLGKNVKERKKQGIFLAEGKRMVSEAPKGWIQKAYVSETCLLSGEFADVLEGLEHEALSDHVMKAVSGTQSPQGILAKVAMPSWEVHDVLERGVYLFLENIQDPGNLGTMLRAAEGAGAAAVFANAGCADLYNPKTVRATMGSIYRMPFFALSDFEGQIKGMKEAGVTIYAAHLDGDMYYDEPDYTGAVGFLIGNEGNGLTEEAARLADGHIKIPLEGGVESLNAAAAATIVMYEAHRQRRR